VAESSYINICYPAAPLQPRHTAAFMSPIRLKLSVMMFLEYFIWGAWYVTMGTYLLQTLKFSGQQSGAAYGTTALAAIVSPFFVGLVADRFFATERILAFLHLAGAGLLFYVSTLTDFAAFYAVLVCYTLCFMPTLALANALAFHQMRVPGAEFPRVRPWGTLGWITAGYVISYLDAGRAATQFRIAAAASVALAVFSLTLPHTPPARLGRKVSVRDLLGLDALQLMKERSFAIFVIGSFLICIPLRFYNAFTNPFLTEMGVTNAAAKQTIGQWSEIVCLLVMPWFFVRLGIKGLMLVAMLAWAIRYGLFAYGNAGPLVWMFYVGLLLHGICYDFFFVSGQIYVDQKAPRHIRAAAQGFITLVTYGAGMFVGSFIAGWVVDVYAGAGGNPSRHDWTSIWMVPAAMAIGVLVLFAAFFRPSTDSHPQEH
jgi:nucleoside transporter